MEYVYSVEKDKEQETAALEYECTWCGAMPGQPCFSTDRVHLDRKMLAMRADMEKNEE
jgi:hypothetical protein